MTLIVNKEILEKLDCCANGIATFESRIGNRTAMSYQEFLALSFEMDKIHPEDMYILYTRELLNTAKFYLLQGAYVMTDKFQVFNHKNGSYEAYTSLDEAVARRQQLIDAFIEENKNHMFSVNREILVNDGQDAMWVPLSDLPNS